MQNDKTPEDRILLAKIVYGKLDPHRGRANTPLDHFDSYEKYKRAKKLYWDTMFRYNLTPRTQSIPPLKTQEDYMLWTAYHRMMQQKFSRVLPL